MADDGKKEEAVDEVIVYYWPIRFRGNFLKIILADAGVKFTSAPVGDVVALKSAAVADQPLPMLAPPMIKVGLFTINSSPAAAQYLARRFGYEPESMEESAVALKIFNDLNDILGELSRGNGSRMWDKEAWTEFLASRFPRWLSIIDGLAAGAGKAAASADGDFCFGAKISYADLAIAHVLSMVGIQFGMKTYLEKHCPAAWKLTERVLARPGVAALFEEQKASYGESVCGGQIEKSIREMLALNLH